MNPNLKYCSEFWNNLPGGERHPSALSLKYKYEPGDVSHTMKVTL